MVIIIVEVGVTQSGDEGKMKCIIECSKWHQLDDDIRPFSCIYNKTLTVYVIHHNYTKNNSQYLRNEEEVSNYG